jgi:hypothetical protein
LELRQAEDRHRFHIAPDGHMPLPEASFDLAISDHWLEHVMNQPLAW